MNGNKRILIVIGSFKTGGAERMAINTGEELFRRGHNVHYFLQKNIIEIPNSIDSSRIYIANSKPHRRGLYLHLANIFKLIIYRIKFKPQVVIGFTYFSSFIACFSFAPKIIGRFDINPFVMKRRWKMYVSLFVSYWPFVDKIIVPSKGLASEIRKVNVKLNRKIYVINNSINAEEILRMGSNELINFDINDNYITAMGRFTYQKNFELLIKSFSASKIFNKYKLVIIGDGAYRPQLEKLVFSLNLEDRVIFTGILSNPFPIVKNSSFFINSSYFESFCNVILEALTLGVPVIATDCKHGPSEMISNNLNGILTANNELDKLTIAINALAEDDGFYLKLKSNTVSSSMKFDVRNIGDHWESILN